MKKILLYMMIMAVLVSLCGCSLSNLQNVEMPEFMPSESAAPDPEPVPDEEPDNSPIVPNINTHEKTIITNIEGTDVILMDPRDQSQQILTFSYETPHVFIEGFDEAAAVINDTLGLIDETYSTGNDYGYGMGIGYNIMCSLAEDNFTYAVSSGEDVNMEFLSERTVIIPRTDDTVITVVYSDYTLTAEGEKITKSAYNFNTETGALYSAEDITEDYQSLINLIACEIENSVDAAGDNDFEAAAEQCLNSYYWALTGDGLSVFYTLTGDPVWNGNIQIDIPFSELYGVVSEKFFPLEDAGNCAVSLVPTASVTEGTVSVIDKLYLSNDDESTADVLIIFEGSAYDVSVSNVSYLESFFETAQLWHCSVIKDSAVQLEINVPEGMPEIKITYFTGAGEKHDLFLSQSGEDGSIALSDGTISAVG